MRGLKLGDSGTGLGEFNHGRAIRPAYEGIETGGSDGVSAPDGVSASRDPPRL